MIRFALISLIAALPCYAGKLRPPEAVVPVEVAIAIPADPGQVEKISAMSRTFLQAYSQVAAAMKQVPGPHLFNWDGGDAARLQGKKIRLMLVSRRENYYSVFSAETHWVSNQEGFSTDLRLNALEGKTRQELTVYLFVEELMLNEHFGLRANRLTNTLSALARVFSGEIVQFLEFEFPQKMIAKGVDAKDLGIPEVDEVRTGEGALKILKLLSKDGSLWPYHEISEDTPLVAELNRVENMTHLIRACQGRKASAPNN